MNDTPSPDELELSIDTSEHTSLLTHSQSKSFLSKHRWIIPLLTTLVAIGLLLAAILTNTPKSADSNTKTNQYELAGDEVDKEKLEEQERILGECDQSQFHTKHLNFYVVRHFERFFDGQEELTVGGQQRALDLADHFEEFSLPLDAVLTDGSLRANQSIAQVAKQRDLPLSVYDSLTAIRIWLYECDDVKLVPEGSISIMIATHSNGIWQMVTGLLNFLGDEPTALTNYGFLYNVHYLPTDEVVMMRSHFGTFEETGNQWHNCPYDSCEGYEPGAQ